MNTSTTAQAIQRAHNEIAKEKQDDAVKLLKAKLRELDTAKVVVANVEREIEMLELAIEQGNV